MNLHTPGLWTTFEFKARDGVVIGVSGPRADVAHIRSGRDDNDSSRSVDEDRANARLIAKAPSMKELLENVLSTLPDSEYVTGGLAFKIEEVLAAIEGRKPCIQPLSLHYSSSQVSSPA